MHQPDPRPFHESWTLADTRSFVDQYASTAVAPTAAQMEVRQGLHRSLHAALAGHLSWLARQGLLGLPPHAEHVSDHWLSAWRRCLSEGDCDTQITRALMMGMCMHLAPHRTLEGVEPAEAVHDRCVAWVKAGNLEEFECAPLSCQNSGLQLQLTFEQWSPKLWVRCGTGPNDAFQPLRAGDVQAPGVERLDIPVPSGEIWIADWFRIEALTQATQRTEEEEASLPPRTTLVGRVAESRRLQKFGLAHFFVGNSGPSVVRQGDRLIMGVLPWDNATDERTPAPQGEDQGCVHTQLWWVTLADRAVLKALMVPALGPEGAERALKAYEEEEGGPIRVKVPAGTHHLYFAGRTSVFHASFASPQVATEGFEEAMGVLSPDELVLVPKVPAPPVGRPRRP